MLVNTTKTAQLSKASVTEHVMRCPANRGAMGESVHIAVAWFMHQLTQVRCNNHAINRKENNKQAHPCDIHGTCHVHDHAERQQLNAIIANLHSQRNSTR